MITMAVYLGGSGPDRSDAGVRTGLDRLVLRHQVHRRHGHRRGVRRRQPPGICQSPRWQIMQGYRDGRGVDQLHRARSSGQRAGSATGGQVEGDRTSPRGRARLRRPGAGAVQALPEAVHPRRHADDRPVVPVHLDLPHDADLRVPAGRRGDDRRPGWSIFLGIDAENKALEDVAEPLSFAGDGRS